MITKRLLDTSLSVLAEQRQAICIVSTSEIARDGDSIVTAGIEYADFLRGGATVLFSHNPDWPVAKCTRLWIDGDALKACMQFPPEGSSKRADETYALIKSGVLSGVSIGYEINESTPLDPSEPFAGRKITRATIFEFSVVAIPCHVGAVITERSAKKRTAKNGAEYHRLMAARYAAEIDVEEISNPAMRAHHRMARLYERDLARDKPKTPEQKRQALAAKYAREL